MVSERALEKERPRGFGTRHVAGHAVRQACAGQVRLGRAFMAWERLGCIEGFPAGGKAAEGGSRYWLEAPVGIEPTNRGFAVLPQLLRSFAFLSIP
jgi:hypothetical protein